MSDVNCEFCSFVSTIELPGCCVVSELVLYELVSFGSFSVDSISELLLVVSSVLMLVEVISELRLVDFVPSLSKPKSFVFGPEL